jgi:hypothetical protein
VRGCKPSAWPDFSAVGLESMQRSEESVRPYRARRTSRKSPAGPAWRRISTLFEDGGWEVYPGYDHFIFLFRTHWLEFWAETRQRGSKRGKDAEISRTLRIFGEDWHVLFVNVEFEMFTMERKEDWVRNSCALTYCLFLILNKDILMIMQLVSTRVHFTSRSCFLRLANAC